MIENVTYVCSNEACSRFNVQFKGATQRIHRGIHEKPHRCRDCGKLPRKSQEGPFEIVPAVPPVAAPAGDWRVRADFATGYVVLTQGEAVVRLAPEEGQEVGQRLFDAAW